MVGGWYTASLQWSKGSRALWLKAWQGQTASFLAARKLGARIDRKGGTRD